jgi:hypothetical protein
MNFEAEAGPDYRKHFVSTLPCTHFNPLTQTPYLRTDNSFTDDLEDRRGLPREHSALSVLPRRR